MPFAYGITVLFRKTGPGAIGHWGLGVGDEVLVLVSELELEKI